MLAHAREAAPHECCGLLIGHGERIAEAIPARNLSEAPMTTYIVDPRDHFAAIRSARARSLDVVGAYHSHPRSAAVPSSTDTVGAFTRFLFVIIGLGTDPPEITAWRWVEGNFDRVVLVGDLKG